MVESHEASSAPIRYAKEDDDNETMAQRQEQSSPAAAGADAAPAAPNADGGLPVYQVSPTPIDNENYNSDDDADMKIVPPVPDGIMKKGTPKKKRLPTLQARLRRPRGGQPALGDVYGGGAVPSLSSEEEENGDDDDHRRTRRAPRRRRDRSFRRGNGNDNGDDDGEEEEDSVTGNWSIDGDPNDHQDEHARAPSATNRNTTRMTVADIAMCQALDLEYERALEDRQVAWSARYQSVRQSTLFSVVFMVLLILTGTAFFLRQADSYWSVSEGLLFTIYTITTVGYGHLDMPGTPAFQIYTCFFIFLGIAMLTILVAQVYQCIALEASRVASSLGGTEPHRRRNGMRLWLEARMREQRELNQHEQQRQQQQNSSSSSSFARQPPPQSTDRSPPAWDWPDWLEWFLQNWDRLRTFLRDNEFGRGLSVVLPFAALIALGAAVIGPLEGWTAVESLYFAVVSLTTVGFGDYYPTRTASIWFCCLWLPFSVGFMSLYLANVAAFYIRLSDRNVARIERILRRRLQRIKERAEQERRAVLRRAMRGQQSRTSSDDLTDEDVISAVSGSVDVEEGVTVVTVDHGKAEGLRQTANRMRGFDTLPTLDADEDADPDARAAVDRNGNATDGVLDTQQGGNGSSSRQLFGTEGSTSHRRERILQNSLKHTEFEMYGKTKQKRTSTSMTTMKDVLRTVHHNNIIDPTAILTKDPSDHGSSSIHFRGAGPESEFLSVYSSQTVLQHDRMTLRKKPSFALRALVQERFAEIIATDIAGYQSNIEIKEYTLAVTIQSLKQTADKWVIPRRARRAFRAVAFEALYFVGEHGLITRGADALFSLTPFEFHQIFSPLLAALGDAETMELWLAHTQALAEVDLVATSTPSSHDADDEPLRPNRTTERDGKVRATLTPAQTVLTRSSRPAHRPEYLSTEELSPSSSASTPKEQELPQIS